MGYSNDEPKNLLPGWTNLYKQHQRKQISSVQNRRGKPSQLQGVWEMGKNNMWLDLIVAFVIIVCYRFTTTTSSWVFRVYDGGVAVLKPCDLGRNGNVQGRGLWGNDWRRRRSGYDVLVADHSCQSQWRSRPLYEVVTSLGTEEVS